MPEIVICVATDLERGVLPEKGEVRGLGFEVLRTGVGPVNASMALTRFLARERVETVISLGVGGAYPGSGLEIGDVSSALSENHGDLGADSPEGFLDMRDLGFEVLDGLFNELPLDRFPCEPRLPFVTRATCTGREQEARSIVERTGGAVESMEGAAVVHVALAHRIPVGEIRGISNRVADRDRSHWRLREAADASSRALLAWIEEAAC